MKTKQELRDKVIMLDSLLDDIYRKCVHAPYDRRNKLLRYLDKVYPECGERCVKKRSELARGIK